MFKNIFDQDIITLDDSTHTYKVKYLEHLQFSSVTTFIHQFFKPFIAEEVAKELAGTKKYRNKTAEDLLLEWDKIAQTGTLVHSELEQFLLKLRDGEIYEGLTHKKSKFGAAWILETFEPSYIPYPEMRIYSEKYQLAGTADLPIYDEKTGLWVLCDWKTNKAIRTSGYGGAKGTHYATRLLDDCNFIHYTLQMSLYQYLLEEEYGITFENRFLLHLLERQTAACPLGVLLYECDYLKSVVIAMLEYRLKQKEAGELFKHSLN